MHATALCLLLTLGGGPRAAASGTLGAASTSGVSSRVFVASKGRQLIGTARAPSESSPAPRFELYEDRPGGSRLIAERVGHAAYTTDGAILYVQDEKLVELAGEERKVLASGVAPDFALNRDGSLLAIVRPLERAGGRSIDLQPRAGGPARRLVEPMGLNGTPVFTPDGKSLIFSSTRTGIASFFRIELDGSGLRQLTNAGLRAGTGAVLSPSFVPPTENRHELRFLDANTLEYRAAGGLWRLDIQTGKASNAEGTR